MSPAIDYLLQDDAARHQALTQESYIVQAPAGAGKTELLTQRFLRLLPTVAQPEEIIAITFTNKAAAEMRARILSILDKAAKGDNDVQAHQQPTYDLALQVLQADRERGWGLLEHAGRLQVTTIDALCAQLARQMPFLSRFGTQPVVRDDCRLHYEAAARATLELLEGSDPAQAAIVAQALGYFDNDNIKLLNQLVTMLGKRDQWTDHVISLSDVARISERGLARMVELELKDIAPHLNPSSQHSLMPAVRYAADMAEQNGVTPHLAKLRDWNMALVGESDELWAWRGLAELLLTGAGSLRKRFDPKLGLSLVEGKPHAEVLKAYIDSLDPTAEAALNRIRMLPDSEISDDAAHIIDALHALLKLASGQLWLVFQAHGEVDFIGVAQRALQALGADDSPTELRERLDARIAHLLVDEFQDTSPNQVGLLARLTSDWQSGDGRTLFLVGDPMQSIYRFRKADVGLFLKVKDRGLGVQRPKTLQLYRNNRSAEELVDWVNQTLPDVLGHEDHIQKGKVAFAPASATRGSLAGATVQVHPFIDLDGDCEPAEIREAKTVIEIIRSTLASLPEGEKIAVLVRARSHLEALVQTIHQHAPDIRYQAVEIEGLTERQVVQDLVALTRALHHRADRVNWLAILRAPWCGLTLSDLHVLAADDHRQTVWQLMQDEARVLRLSEDGQQRLRHVRAVLQEAFAHQGRQRVKRWVEGVWQMLGGPLCLQSTADHLDVQAFLALLDKLERNGRLELERLNEELGKLYAAPDPNAGTSVQFMTIHKAKGLEFDTVILPGLQRTPPAPDKNLLIWDEFVLEDGEEHLVAAPVNTRNKGKTDVPTAYDYLSQLEKERTENELQRVLYVAVTRAKRCLHLLGSARMGKNGLNAPSANSLLGLLWHVLSQDFAAAADSLDDAVTDQVADAGASEFVPKLVRLSRPEVPEGLRCDVPIRPDGAHALAQEDHIDTLESAIGTLTHRYLEWIATDGLAAWPTERIQGLTSRLLGWFALQGFNAVQAEQAALIVTHYLESTVASDTGRWLLARHEDDRAELALTQLQDTQSKTHVIDRTFIHEGVRWIIDYKTSQTDKADLDGFLAEKIEEYRPQLERYASLYQDSETPVRPALFFVAYQILRPLH